jgi:hypothetical protein
MNGEAAHRWGRCASIPDDEKPIHDRGGAEASPIFIIGTERSGSNLLRLILNTHSQIAAPHPPHFMAYFGPIEKYYGDLSVDRNYEALIDDLLIHVRGHIHPWPFTPRRSELFLPERRRDLLDASYSIYDQYAAHVGKPRWACKSTFMIHYCDRILAQFPGAKLIWLIRDPRDVAYSSTRSVFNPYHPYYTAMLWKVQQALGLELAARLPSSSRPLRIHYEDLVREPTKTVIRICHFVGVPFESSMLRYFETEDAQASARLSRDWSNAAVPVLNENAGKYAVGLTADAISIVESAANPIMQRLGYQPTSQRMSRMPPSAGELIRFRWENEMLRVRAECRSIAVDRIGFRRWRRTFRMALHTLRFRLKIPRVFF